MTVRGSVVVTGGSRGIGRAFVVDAARRGYDVFLTHRGRASDAEEAVAAAQEAAPGATVTAVEADLLDRAALENLITTVLDHGPVHLLVNNAGTMAHGLLDELTEEGWKRSFDVHVTAPMVLARGFAESLASTHGAILNVSSTGGVVGSVHGAAYGASKAAILGFSKSLARELAPFVRVNTLAPGPVGTDMYADLPEDERRAVEAETPLGRVAEPWEIARAGLDLCHWTYATGQTLVADGGRVLT
ncbi:SDR family oxidoreductase [Nocardioides marmoriginsengisoli]|uniref:SDR family oxidoreductase n=1 Tax=Nocardioides marmoriginsengisoli TaxID=661483 RepID=A0A3N0CGA9_9ACTN|nr:SDR family oxidoreductase [Nocardioides marmoriginsengisoli]RNL62494.1 SDR family oxidoreductase [Nocardioides marmoriginsengisoli]